MDLKKHFESDGYEFILWLLKKTLKYDLYLLLNLIFNINKFGTLFTSTRIVLKSANFMYVKFSKNGFSN